MPLRNFSFLTEINKGWSGDRKFCAVDRDGNKYLLRISPHEKADRKKAEYAMAKEVASLGIPMCMPVDFWTGCIPDSLHGHHRGAPDSDAQNRKGGCP